MQIKLVPPLIQITLVPGLKMLFFLLFLTFAHAAISQHAEVDMESKPLCLLDLEMKDGCDGEHKCICPPNSVCKVTSAEDGLSACLQPLTTTLEPLETTPQLPICKIPSSIWFDSCDRLCVCPEGYECKLVSTMIYQCEPTAVVEPDPTPLPICTPDLHSPFEICDKDCVCPEGTECAPYYIFDQCPPIQEPLPTTPEPLQTTPELPTCNVPALEWWEECDIVCVCPDEYECVSSGWERACKKPAEEQSVLEKVDELANEAIDLAQYQLDMAEQIHEVIEEEEEEDGEGIFKQFA